MSNGPGIIQSLKQISPYYSMPALASAFVGVSGYALGYFMAPIAVAAVAVGAVAYGSVLMLDTLNAKYEALTKKLYDSVDEFANTAKAATATIEKAQKSFDEVNEILGQVKAVLKNVEDTKQVENLAAIENRLNELLQSIDPEQISHIVSDVEATTQKVNEDIIQDAANAVARFSQATMIFGGPHQPQPVAQQPAAQQADPQSPADQGSAPQVRQGRARNRR